MHLCKICCIIANRDKAFIQNVMLFHTKDVPKRIKRHTDSNRKGKKFPLMNIKNRVGEIIQAKWGLKPHITKEKLEELKSEIGEDFTINRHNQIINNKGDIMDARELMAYSKWLNESIENLTYVPEN